MNVEQIDRNFAVQTSLKLDDVKFYNIQDEPFTVYGVFWENGCYRRVPEAIAPTVSEGVAHACKMTSGGRIKFKTNSPYIALQAKFVGPGRMAQFALTGSAGFAGCHIGLAVHLSWSQHVFKGLAYQDICHEDTEDSAETEIFVEAFHERRGI